MSVIGVEGELSLARIGPEYKSLWFLRARLDFYLTEFRSGFFGCVCHFGLDCELNARRKQKERKSHSEQDAASLFQ